jgi:hypothetical protein
MAMSPKLILCALGALFFASCTVDKQLSATGGSRSDGIVELSYEIGDMQSARIDWNRAQQDATARCAAWGYQNAEKFGGEKRQCQAPSQYGCLQWFVTVNYQCTNAVSSG